MTTTYRAPTHTAAAGPAVPPAARSHRPNAALGTIALLALARGLDLRDRFAAEAASRQRFSGEP